MIFCANLPVGTDKVRKRDTRGCKVISRGDYPHRLFEHADSSRGSTTSRPTQRIGSWRACSRCDRCSALRPFVAMPSSMPYTSACLNRQSHHFCHASSAMLEGRRGRILITVMQMVINNLESVSNGIETASALRQWVANTRFEFETKPTIEYLVIQPRPTRPSQTQQIFGELENFFEATVDNTFQTEMKAFRDITDLISLDEAAKDPKRREVDRTRAQETLTAKSNSVELQLEDVHYKVASQNIITLVNRLKAARQRDAAADKYRPAMPLRESIPNMLQNISVRFREIERSGAPRRFERIFRENNHICRREKVLAYYDWLHVRDSGGTSAAETKPDIEYLVIQPRPTRSSQTQQISGELETFFEAAVDTPFKPK